MASVAVTGASGYVGGLVCRAFLAKGWRVFALSRRDPEIDDVEWLYWSLEDAALPRQAMPLDCLVHAAYDFAVRDRRESRIVNVQGSTTLMNSLPDGCRGILISSIVAAVASERGYALNKQATESVMIARGGVVIRPGLVRGDSPGGMVGKLARVARLPLLPVPAAHALQYTTSARTLQDLVVTLAEDGQWRPQTLTPVDGPPVEFIELLRRLAGPRSLMFPVPWRPIWLVLRTAETLGVRTPIAAESLYGLANPGTAETGAARRQGLD